MRLATYNVENLFERPRAMNGADWASGAAALADFARLGELIAADEYGPELRAELLAIVDRHRGLASTGSSPYLRLREVRGRLLRRTAARTEVLPAGRGDWVGWFELRREPIKAAAIDNTARIIGLLDADVLAIVEAEDRPGLKRFNKTVLPRVKLKAYEHVMLIDGNDERGIDVGLMSRAGYPIESMVSHVDDRDAKGPIFSRDCAEYRLRTPGGASLLLLVNHFKSKGYGSPAASAAKRLRQARRVRALVDQRLAEGCELLAVVGDLNETPDAAPMAPLSGAGSPLMELMRHPRYQHDGRPGTYGSGIARAKLDYILMSPKLAARVKTGGIERRGVWVDAVKPPFPRLDSIRRASEAASDHAALWVDLDL